MNNNNRIKKDTGKIYKFDESKKMYIGNVLDEYIGEKTVSEIISERDEYLELSNTRSKIIGRLKSDKEKVILRNDQLEAELNDILEKGIGEYLSILINL